MKVTNSNIAYVAHLLKKSISNGFTHQRFYPEAKKRNLILNHFNIKNIGYELYSIEESNLSTFDNVSIEQDQTGSDKYIRIHNNGTDSGWDYYDSYKAFCIYIGDEITFNKNLIVIRCPFVIHNAKSIVKIKY